MRNAFKQAASLSILALILASPTPAFAGKANDARAAIASAKGKIEAGDKVGASVEAGRMQAQARAALQNAESALSHGHKDEAITAARHAGELADQALILADQRKTAAATADRRGAEAEADAAHDTAAAATARAASAEQSAAMNAQAAQSNAQMAADANARADAMRAAPPAMASATTTTERIITPAPTVKRHVTHHGLHRKVVKRAPSKVVEKTTTTLTTAPNQ